MATVKERRSGNHSTVTCLAPSRTLAPSGCQVRYLAEGDVNDEQTLLERVQGICREYGQHRACQVTINSYQALPPEAVSVMDPPERAWFVRLYLVGQERDQTTGEVEIIAVLRGGEVNIMLR